MKQFTYFLFHTFKGMVFVGKQSLMRSGTRVALAMQCALDGGVTARKMYR